jgi:hypothetical protein
VKSLGPFYHTQQRHAMGCNRSPIGSLVTSITHTLCFSPSRVSRCKILVRSYSSSSTDRQSTRTTELPLSHHLTSMTVARRSPPSTESRVFCTHLEPSIPRPTLPSVASVIGAGQSLKYQPPSTERSCHGKGSTDAFFKQYELQARVTIKGALGKE